MAKEIIEEVWKQNKDIFESMDRKEMINQIVDFMIEDLMDKIDEWRDL